MILWGENIKDPWGWEIKHSNKTDQEIIRVKEAEVKNKKKKLPITRDTVEIERVQKVALTVTAI